MTRAQLLAAGIGRGAIQWRLDAGRLHRIYAGVYLVGDLAAPPLAKQMAAVLACGERAVISHRSAAALWRLLPDRPHADPEVTVAAARARQRRGIRTHRTASLDRRDVRRIERIPVTAPARSLLDLAAVAGAHELERAVAEAERRRLVRRRELTDELQRHRRRAGTASLLAVLDRDGGPAWTRSEAERRLLRLVRAARLPTPELNVHVGDFEVDFLWREERVIIEVDGYAVHSPRPAFERDRSRDAELQARGFRVIRVTWRQLTGESEALLARLARALVV